MRMKFESAVAIALGIWQDGGDQHEFAGGYQRGRRFVRGMRGTCSPDARVIVETARGQGCHGTGLMLPAAVSAHAGGRADTRL